MKNRTWIAIVMALTFVVAVEAHAAVKCQPDGRGGMCCWDTDKDGIYKPVGC